MNYKEIDMIFPFVVFAYGFVMTFVLHTPLFMEIADRRVPIQLIQQFKAHRILGLLSLVVGGLWSLQNLWFYS